MKILIVDGAARSLIALLGAALAGCASPGAQTVATDVQVVEKPVPMPCSVELPERPTPYVALVQLTGDQAVDLVAIERAKEAELEARIGYEAKLEAAAKKCIAPP